GSGAMSSFRTDHSRARGLGAARHGAGHWLSERISAVALAPLSLWAVYAGLYLARAQFEEARAWLGQPLNAVLLSLLLLTGFWHMHAGMRVIIEDYVHKTFGKASLLILNLFICVLGGAMGLFAVLKVALLGGAF